jgi:hypothetical protein
MISLTVEDLDMLYIFYRAPVSISAEISSHTISKDYVGT